MKRLMAPSILTMTLVSLLACTAPGQAPSISVSHKKWDFGVKDQGIQEDHTVAVTNTGKAALLILEVGSTCGCIGAEMKSRRVEPGSTVDFLIHLDATRKTGRVEKSAWFSTNDPKNRRVTVVVEGTIRASWRTSKVTLHFGKVPLGSQVTRSLFVYAEPGRGIKLEKVTVDDLRFEVNASPFSDTNGSGGWKVDVFLKGPFKPGSFNGNLSIHTNFANYPMQVVPLLGVMVGSVVMEPSRISLGIVTPKKPVRRTVMLRSMGKKPLRILNVNCSDKNLTTRVVAEKPGHIYRLEIQYLTMEKTGKPIRGSIWVKTNDAKRRLLRIPFYGRTP